MRHHTKDKGDLGVVSVMGDLMKHDIDVALPISEHLPFDLVAIHPEGKTIKVSVKYRIMGKNGTVRVNARSVWNDRHGTHYRAHQPGDYDAIAIYCPDTNECYYLRSSEMTPSGITLRITNAANNQVAGVTPARWFVDPERLFAAFPNSEGARVECNSRARRESNPRQSL